jgi:hypothetical protein
MQIQLTARPGKFVFISDTLILKPNESATLELINLDNSTLRRIYDSYLVNYLIMDTTSLQILEENIANTDTLTNNSLIGKVPTLDENQLIKTAYLPSYIDDIIVYPTRLDFPIIGDIGKIYVSQLNNISYRYDGISDYFPLGQGGTSDDIIEGNTNLFLTPTRLSNLVSTVNGASGTVTTATVAQGLLADTAIQPEDLSGIAISGSYYDIVDVPLLLKELGETVSTANTVLLFNTLNKPVFLNLGSIAQQILQLNTFNDLKVLLSLSKNDVQLNNVQNLDQTNPTNIAQTSNYRFVTDAFIASVNTNIANNTGDETKQTIQTKLGSASVVNSGYLTNTDWNIFNNKQNQLPYSTNNLSYLKGDLTIGTLGQTALTNSYNDLSDKPNIFESLITVLNNVLPNTVIAIGDTLQVIIEKLQGQLNNKQPLSSILSNISNGVYGTSQLIFKNASNNFEGLSLSNLKTLLNLNNVPNVDTTLRDNHTGTQPATTIIGLSPVATTGLYADLSNTPDIQQTVISDYVVGSNTSVNNADTIVGALGKTQSQLNNKQALNANLTQISAIIPSSVNSYIKYNGTTYQSTTISNIKTDLNLSKADVQLNNVDNTSDLNKPLSTAAISALSTKEPSITSSTSTSYWGGDKVFYELTYNRIQQVPQKLIDIVNTTNTAATYLRNNGSNWVNGSIATMKIDLGIYGNIVQALPFINTTIPMYLANNGEYWFVQNSFAQHTVRYIQATTGTTTFSVVGGLSLTTTGNSSAVTSTVTNEWTQSPRINITNGALSSVCGLRTTVATHFLSQIASNNFGFISNLYFGINDSINGARMFVGDSNTNTAPTDVEPTGTQNNYGICQSSTLPNPNNFYIVINGTAATAYTVDTGIAVTTGTGYKLSIISNQGQTILGFRLTNVNTDTTFEHTVDIMALPTTNRPISSGYLLRSWRSTNGNTFVNVNFQVSRYYNEIKN